MISLRSFLVAVGGGIRAAFTVKEVRPRYSRALHLPELEPVDVSSLPIVPYRRHTQSQHFRAILQSGQAVYFGCEPGNEWVNVYARKRRPGEKSGVFTGDYAEFGFALNRNNWSYGKGAPAAGEIRAFIDALVARGAAG